MNLSIFVATLIGMAIQSFIVAILMRLGTIEVSSGQQALAGCLYVIAALSVLLAAKIRGRKGNRR